MAMGKPGGVLGRVPGKPKQLWGLAPSCSAASGSCGLVKSVNRKLDLGPAWHGGTVLSVTHMCVTCQHAVRAR